MAETLCKTRYGHFAEDGREFVIIEPKTPRPWSTVVSNGDAGFIVSQSGGGYSWRGNAQVNRLTRWDQDIIKDEWGKYLYLRDAETGEVWSAAWKPICADPERYEVRYGTGYAVITSRNGGIETEWTMFVAPDEPVELWKLVLRNRTRSPRAVQVFTYFEWGLGAAPDWHREFHKCFTHTRYDAKTFSIRATKRLWEVPSDNGHWNVNWPYVAFFASNARPASFDASKENVLGNYGSVRQPEGIVNAKLRKETGNQLDPVASLQLNVTLPARGEKTVCFALGAADNDAHATTLISKYRPLAAVEKALAAVQRRWDEMLAVSNVETPDSAMNVMLNRWLKYQAIAGRLLGRTGYYQSGGAYGFRDQLQDSQVFLSIDPEQTKRQILLHARHQFKDGTVYHWWHPLSEVGLPTNMTDDLLWLPYVVCSYIEETDNYSILDLREPFLDDANGGTIYDHCVRAIDRVYARFSSRGLPLIGAGDWNDGISSAGLHMRGESVWLGQFYHRILLDFSSVAAAHGDAVLAQTLTNRAATLRESINTHGWDGEWYYYGTKDSGEKFGSKENKEGTIHLNPQTWAVIADIADENRAAQVMNQVVKRLEHKAGTLLLYPAYNTPDEKIGYLTRYAPGTRENGATYTHAATWSVIAMAKLGRAADAYRLFSKINPTVRGASPDEYCAEPYVTAGNIDGPDSRYYGRGGWTWYSGSAAWLYKAGLEWILGVRASRTGLVVSPCIPEKWKSYKVKRVYRNATYLIEVRNPSRVSRGIVSVMMDGEKIPSFTPCISVTLPLLKAGSAGSCIIEMGDVK